MRLVGKGRNKVREKRSARDCFFKEHYTCGAGQDEVGGAATPTRIRLPDPALKRQLDKISW